MNLIDVSVVVAVKNEARYIESAVTSIATQAGVAHEVVVVDDGSSDATLSILEELAKVHSCLRVLRNPRSGKCSAFNFGVRQTFGRFVCIFAGDDIMPPDSLAARFAMVKDLPPNQPVVGLCKLVTMSEIPRFDGHLVPRKSGRGALSGVSPLMDQQILNTIFPVPEVLPNEDTWMELAVLHYPGWQVVHSDIVGCAWRVHSGNSINMMAGFDEYNRKITARLRAYSLFLNQHGARLTDEGRTELQGKVLCEERRVKGQVIGVLTSPVSFVDRLRALSITNSMLYGVRRRLYGLFSGW